MSREIKRIFVNGFPGLYGGASTELHHQILCWVQMGMEVHIIPTHPVDHEALYPSLIAMGVIVHEPNDFSALSKGDPILGFCSSEFLNNLTKIRQYTSRTVFINCMTWLFDKEKEMQTHGNIAMYLYQNENVRQDHMARLRALNNDPKIKFMTFKPYFHAEDFPYIKERRNDVFGCGRISRQDADKFARYTLHVYDYFVAPVMKEGVFLGFSNKSREKVGNPPDWIHCAADQRFFSQQDFYKHCKIVLQPTDTTENWPRIGFEAMSSGSVLIVDNRGGWQRMVEHGKTGWLCKSPQEFIYYASKMAFEPNMRDDMAAAAKIRGEELGSLAAASASWEEVFYEMAKLPE